MPKLVDQYAVFEEVTIVPTPTAYEQITITADFAKHALALAAFPLLTGLYAKRGANQKPLKASQIELKALKQFNTNLETLTEWYSILVPVGFFYTKFSANSLGIISFVWTNMVGLVREDAPSIIKLLETTGLIGDYVTWISGVTGFSALSVWIYRHQVRRQKEQKLPVIGVPEVSLALFAAEFASLVLVPSNPALNQHTGGPRVHPVR
ncbi:hypothetical protein B0I72DRAFT_20002 [Yarrowia lipolytica]|jgi:hypothetical protein|uniref:YALI0D23837p n=2 Tax=Yarrowia lipolytica TaxID=4952 RepID=Q6C805_YARLI|nr:YALI0D23837p [Yarrowia lipolytica CLIB122]AOW04545.1 hypothetical protein YALI1_D30899g [Yarrowia lipolytica]KAB8285661.1 hypothetical protein BKA91DRAFT_29105 [Yarrowia lipolytica]KAE8172536.1 hypothetical protein BKA90DRAFT_17023 [Yarrowia lipolytica]KAJ8054005.1 hypothetical protein LXG23DRAFT_20440 [Yarrowia lipolytica]QNP98228.1 Hypothetical protein YALI2_D00669g [Yarrowia lipolytica]|eukprot:XP_503207.1 YALI0D23837p [Yarrowia lipolytica CLIB122]